MMSDFETMKSALLALADTEKKVVLQRFFKSSPGDYGEGDLFVGIPVPKNRALAKGYLNAPLPEVARMLSDPIHECRLFALLNCVERFKKCDEAGKKEIFDLYVSNTKYINNWDLVDLSVYQIVGRYLELKDRSLLYRFAQSDNLWEQRMSIVATWEYIRKGDFADTIKLADVLLDHPHDLIQKATGWMLREIGKRDKEKLIDFLNVRYRDMPRTMLRYAIEKFTSEERAIYMKR